MRITAVSAVFGILIVAACASSAGKLERVYYGGNGGGAPMPLVADGPPDPAVEKLLKALGDDDWRIREQAGRDLAALGEKALPHMRRALAASDSPEVRQRLAVLVRKLDHDRLVSAKRVTFKAKERTAAQLFDEIAKKTGYRIEFGDNGGTEKFSFEFEDTPFWKALDTVANAAGCSVYMDYEGGAIRVNRGDTVNPHVAYAGPFRFLATYIQSSRSVQLSNINRRGGPERQNEYTNLNFQIESEPKNPMLGVSQPILDVATDDKGGSLLVPRNNNGYDDVYRSNYYNRGSRAHNMSMSVSLNRTDRSATMIKTLKGKVRVELLSGTTPEVVVADPLKVKKQSFAGRTTDLEITEVTQDPNQKDVYHVHLTARNRNPIDPRRGDDYMWANNLPQRLELMDADGNRYFSYGLNESNFNNGVYQMKMMFGTEDRRWGRPGPVKLGAPAKLVLNEWHTVTHEVAFEFKDIPLP